MLNIDMPPVLIESNPRVDATRGCVAIQRGPIVYCLEDQDQEVPNRLLDTQIDTSAPLEIQWRGDLLEGVTTLQARGYIRDLSEWQGHLYKPLTEQAHLARRPVRLTAIPYYAWGNRGIRSMRVWIPRG